MKLTDYIKQLQYLHSQYGDAEVTVHTKCIQQDLNFDEYYTIPDKPYYDKDHNYYVIHSNFLRYDD